MTSLLGGALIRLATGPDPASEQIAVFRSHGEAADIALATKTVFDVQPLQSFSFAIGDNTRSNQILDPGFGQDGAWIYGPGWMREGGRAVHLAGEAGGLEQMQELVAGRVYRLGWELSAGGSGSLQIGFGNNGEPDDPAPPATQNGLHRARLLAKPGNDRLVLSADAEFAGRIDNVTLYPETPGCLPAGRHHFWLQPQNGDGVPGALCGPFTVEVI